MSTRHHSTTLFIAIALLATSMMSPFSMASDTPAEKIELNNLDHIQSFKQVGAGVMRWFWFDIYQATLRTPSGQYTPNQHPLTLELTYKRNISREDLIKTTEEEWIRQDIDYQKSWLLQLTSIWPSVREQDRILLHIDHTWGSHFFFNEQYMGSINNEKFSRAFIAIWLSDNTLKPKLRSQLTGRSS